ncbi:MAG: rod shape-determining protein RodA [Bacteroidales bacterium]|nr:rod shape-determining protein RodA [Bacteroidales bacterium]
MRRKENIFKNIDWYLVITYFLLVIFGWISIYAAGYKPNVSSIFDISQNYGKQLIWIVASTVLILIILMIDPKFFSALSYTFYAICILLLIGVLMFGSEIGGAKSWFKIGGFAMQPSEFTKIFTNLAIAKYLSSININNKKKYPKLKIAFIIGLPILLIFLQNDTGSALVYLAFIIVLFRDGFFKNTIIIGTVLIILFIVTLLLGKILILQILAGLLLLMTFLLLKKYKKYKKTFFKILGIFAICSVYILSVDYIFENVLQYHQRTRIEILLGKKTDPHGAGYNVNQSKIAIGSGGFTGKGFLKGTQTKYNFIPAQSTDFIFCTVGEDFGFIGALTIIVLFLFLIIRIIILAERQRSKFSRLYGYGVASILFFHFSINVGMTIGLFPVIGIPLPFFSYGGSSLWSFTILLFIFIKQCSKKNELI